MGGPAGITTRRKPPRQNTFSSNAFQTSRKPKPNLTAV
jgi:hypothetical protein